MDYKIIKNQDDNRIYQYIELENKLGVILVQDPDADKSAASMTVNIGSLEDPDDRNGLAHFLEHMLFLGTETYPNVEEYRAYLSKNGGTQNASTSMLETTYYFNCSNEALEGALDRFSKFFISPLFDEKYVQKEMNAVDSEHEKNKKEESRKINQVVKSQAKGKLNRFSTGNLQTLNHPTIREDIIKFYQEHYSANLMRLGIVSKADIETLKKFTLTYFNQIPNYNYTVPFYQEMPYDETNLMKFFKIVPAKDYDQLKLSWIIDYQMPNYKKGPASYLSHLIGHEGENSLLSLLIDEGLALELSSGFSSEMRKYSIFNITITLTKIGVANYLVILNYVFAYIKMLKEKGVQQWIFQEIKIIKELAFQNKDKEKPLGYITDLTPRLHLYPVEEILICPYLMRDYDEELTKKTINSFTLENLRIFFISKSLEDQCSQVEPIYNTKYNVESLQQCIIDSFNNPDVSQKKSKKILDLPPENIFLPKNMTVFGKNEKDLPQLPIKIYETEASEAYFKQDNQFFTPRAQITLKVYTIDLGIGQRYEINLLAKLWINILYNYLRELVYLAEQARVYSNINMENSLVLEVYGFNDSIPQFTHVLINKLLSFNPEIQEQQFILQKQNILRIKNNVLKDKPNVQSPIYEDYLLYADCIDPEIQIKIAEKLTFSDFITFSKNWLKTIRFEWLIIGNMTKEIAINIIQDTENQLQQALHYQVLPKYKVYQQRIVQIPTNNIMVWQKYMTENEGNSGCLVQLQNNEEMSNRQRAILNLIVNIFKQPVFTTLRTEEQLGYSVHTILNNRRGVGYLKIEVQGNAKSPAHISQRIDNIFQKMKVNLQNISEEELQNFRNSVILQFKEKHVNIYQEGNYYWTQIYRHRYQFNINDIIAEEVAKVTKDELIQYADNLIFNNPRRIELWFISPKHKEEHESILKEMKDSKQNLKMIENPNSFKLENELFPDYFAPNY